MMAVLLAPAMLRKVQELFRTFFCPVTVGMLSLMTAKMAAAILSLAANALIAIEDIKKGQKVTLWARKLKKVQAKKTHEIK